MIKLQVIGHLGRDANKNEVGGKTVINFTVAHSENFTDKNGEKQSKTLWVDCAKWGEQTGILPYLTKGSQVYVEGQPEVRTWEKDGKSGASLTLRVSQIQLIGGRTEQQQQQRQQPEPTYQNPAITPIDYADVDSDLPF
jgi:single-strand DNA-binding protein